uniref:Uncharacterized protein LOC114334253 n=1 Tax=Diabrotica virgifera virgifera TaxID=50390 RepID=A0A6P7FUR5_DIAVI
MDKDKRKNNLIISGLEIDTDDSAALKERAGNMIGKHLGVSIKRACKNGIRTCLIELGNGEEKTAILRNKNKLKNVEPKKIWITEDFTKEREREREKMKSLRDKAREMRDKGKTVNIGYNKITVDGNGRPSTMIIYQHATLPAYRFSVHINNPECKNVTAVSTYPASFKFVDILQIHVRKMMKAKECLLFLFDRPKEPLSIPKGPDGVRFDVPKEYLKEEYQNIVEKHQQWQLIPTIAKLRITPRTPFSADDYDEDRIPYDDDKSHHDKKTVRVKPIKLPSLAEITEIGKNENFSLFIPKHQSIAAKLTSLFMGK